MGLNSGTLSAQSCYVGDFMKLCRAFASIVSTGLLTISCGKQSDITSKSLSSHLAGSPGSSQCPLNLKNNAADEAKLRIMENSYGELLGIQIAEEVKLKKGHTLVFSVDEVCLYERRQEQGSEKNELLKKLKVDPDFLKSKRSHALKLEKDFSISDLNKQIIGDSCISVVGENVIATTSSQSLAAPNDPKLSSQKHMPNIKAPEAYDQFYSPTIGITKEVVIAIIDSGVDWKHEDLKNVMWINSGETPGNGIDDDGNGYVDDVYGYNFSSNLGDPAPERWTGSGAGGEIHGTHVAGLAAAQSNNNVGVAGVMGEKAKIMALNVFGKVAGAETANIDEAIKYAADMGADVINMSLGGPGRGETTADAIRYAVGKGVVVIAAAGNDNKDINTNFFTPASYGSDIQGMLAIGAIDSATNARCSFSNYNTTRVEMGAPGCNGLYATVPGNAYQSLQGTSMASPVAAGSAALTMGLIKTRTNADPNPNEVEDILKVGSRKESGLNSFFRDGRTVDLVALYTEVDKRYPSAGTPPPACP